MGRYCTFGSAKLGQSLYSGRSQWCSVGRRSSLGKWRIFQAKGGGVSFIKGLLVCRDRGYQFREGGEGSAQIVAVT